MQGKGVTQNDAEASRLLKLAAAEGLIDAQWFLGGMYQRGRGLPQDFVLAHMWFNLSASQGDMGAQEMRENIAKRMTPQQIARAQQLAQECLSRNYKNCD
jgi:TPR repeat protein